MPASTAARCSFPGTVPAQDAEALPAPPGGPRHAAPVSAQEPLLPKETRWPRRTKAMTLHQVVHLQPLQFDHVGPPLILSSSRCILRNARWTLQPRTGPPGPSAVSPHCAPVPMAPAHHGAEQGDVMVQRIHPATQARPSGDQVGIGDGVGCRRRPAATRPTADRCAEEHCVQRRQEQQTWCPKRKLTRNRTSRCSKNGASRRPAGCRRTEAKDRRLNRPASSCEGEHDRRHGQRTQQWALPPSELPGCAHWRRRRTQDQSGEREDGEFSTHPPGKAR